MPLVTLQAAVDHLKIPIVLDATPIDPQERDLRIKLAAAEAVIVNYIQPAHPEWIDETTTPLDVQACILLQLGELWRFRGDDPDSGKPSQTDAYLSPTITNLLRRYRDPSIA
jgi:hypothetical protein